MEAAYELCVSIEFPVKLATMLELSVWSSRHDGTTITQCYSV